MEETYQTELDLLSDSEQIYLTEEPELELNIDDGDMIEKMRLIEDMNPKINIVIKPVKQKRFPYRFFYEDNYEIYYSNRKNQLMVKNYKIAKYHNMKLSSFILRYHEGFMQDDTQEIITCRIIIEYFESQLKNGNLSCEFFINDDYDRLWVVIKTAHYEYFYDITTHFLILCCNKEEYDWYSLLECDYVDNLIDYEVASNKAQYKLLISWIHDCLKNMFFISHDTTN